MSCTVEAGHLRGKQELGDLDGVQRRALPEVVAYSEQGETVPSGGPDSPDQHFVTSRCIERRWEDIRSGIVHDSHPWEGCERFPGILG